jgi:hypothetical protein
MGARYGLIVPPKRQTVKFSRTGQHGPWSPHATPLHRGCPESGPATVSRRARHQWAMCHLANGRAVMSGAPTDLADGGTLSVQVSDHESFLHVQRRYNLMKWCKRVT